MAVPRDLDPTPALDQVRERIPDPGGTGEVRLLDGSRLPVSRDRMPDLRRRLA